jgi:glycosyltransferase involved in cell wall biosynthesis
MINVGTVLGGAEIYLERLTALLTGNALLFSVCAQPALAGQLRAHGVRVIGVPAILGRRAHRVAKYPICLCIALYIILRHRIQTVHFNGYQSSFMAIPARVCGCFTILTPHHLPSGRLALHWYVENARWVHRIINVSAVVDRQHRSLLPQLQTAVIPNWIPCIPSQLIGGPAVEKRRLLFVGRLVDAKGLPDLIKAIGQLHGQVSLIVSGDGPSRSEYEKLAKDLPVSFVGYYPDLAKLYCDVDALVVPSHGPEGSCLVALEAMAHSLPCIVSDLPAYREIAEDGEAALLFHAGEGCAIATAIQRLMSDAELRSRLAANAYGMVNSKYSSKAASARYLEVFGLNSSPPADFQGFNR